MAGRAPRTVAIVCSANVYVAPLPWLAQLTLRGVAVRVKPARGQEAAIRAIAACFPRTEVHVWKGGDVEAEAAALRDVDGVIAFGGADALAAVHARLAPGVVWLPFGPRFGVAIVEEVTEGLALDHALFDGHGCMSPAAVFVRTPAGHDLPDTVLDQAARLLEVQEARLPRAPLDPGDAVAIRSRLLLARAAGRVRLGSTWAVAQLPTRHFSVEGLPRLMVLHPWSDLAEVEALLRPWADALGTVAWDAPTRAAWEARAAPLPPLTTLGHAPRHCEAGEMQHPPTRRFHEGIDVLGALWRHPS